MTLLLQRLPAELVLGQITPDTQPDTVRDLVKQAFVSVDREYFGSIGELLAARMVLRDRPGSPLQENCQVHLLLTV